MHILGELKYGRLKQGVGYLRLEYPHSAVHRWITKAEEQFNVKLKRGEAHVSIVRDEPIPYQKEWYKHKHPIGVDVEGEDIYTDGKFYWMDVRSMYVGLLRQELGLSTDPRVPLHLTLGRRVFS